MVADYYMYTSKNIIKNINDVSLKILFSEAVNKEEYKKASIILKEINRRYIIF